MQFRKGLGKRQPDSETLRIARPFIAELDKRLENLLAPDSRNGWSVVPEIDGNIVPLDGNADVDIGFGILYGIVNQIVDDFHERLFISRQHYMVLWMIELQLDVPVLGCLRKIIACVVYQVHDVNVLALKDIAVLLHLHEVQQFLYQFVQIVRAVAYYFQVIGSVGRLFPGHYVLQRSTYERKRCLDFVDDIGEKGHFLCQHFFLPLLFQFFLGLSVPVLLSFQDNADGCGRNHQDDAGQCCQSGRRLPERGSDFHPYVLMCRHLLARRLHDGDAERIFPGGDVVIKDTHVRRYVPPVMVIPVQLA